MKPAGETPIRQGDFQIVSGVDQLKVLAHPSRMRILGELREEALTGSMVAERLGIPANRAHYHLRLLFKAGFVQLQGTGRKRWNEERFYIAAARHFFIDPAFACDDARTASTLRSTAERCFSRWRREEILDIGLAEIAARVVRDCLRIQPGELVVVTVNPLTIEIAEILAVELEACGARYHLQPWSKSLVLQTIDRHTRESLSALPFLDPVVDNELAAVIHLSTTDPQPFTPTAEQKALLPLRLEALSGWQRSVIDRLVRYVEISLPRRSELSGVHTSAEEGLDTFWRSFRATPVQLEARALSILRAVRENPRIRLGRKGAPGLGVEVDLERFRVCDGNISDKDLNSGQSVDNFPTGCLSLLPRRGTASGTLRADYTYAQGKHLRDVELEVEEGRLVDVRAGADTELLQAMFREAVGEPYLLSEVAFGVNPMGHRLTGKATLDSCLQGVVTLTFGNNELLGGDVRSTLTVNLPCEKLTVSAGDTIILDSGRYCVGEEG